ncbi:MAG: nodulation protein NodH [Rhodobacteraceae bacterium]|nr:nodulation protein NodH [Paracoccaceae bacterium]
MAGRFTSFVILGAMRTGSNFLEASLSELPGVTTYGEVFNPLFIGREKCWELFDITLPLREADPIALLQRLRDNTEGLPGFRYLSFRIALETDTWIATEDGDRREARIAFKPRQFAEFLADTDAFYARVRRGLRVRGQAAFEIAYDELGDVEVLNGLAAWLGVEGRLEAPSSRLKRLNPPDIAQKVTNPQDIAPAIAALDLNRIDRPRDAEPERNAAINSYLAAPKAPLLYLPVKGGPVRQVKAWLAAVDGAKPPDLLRDFGYRTLRDWRAANPGFRSFTVVRHPLARAHTAFCTHLLMPGPECFGKIRMLLRKYYWLEFPEDGPGRDYRPAEHRMLFLAFLRFLRQNLAGLTSIRVDPSWASQEAVLRGFAARQIPDYVLRAEALAEGLAQVAAQIGRAPPPLPPAVRDPGPVQLAEVYDSEIEAAAREVYAGDYAAFGYGDWRG